MLKQPINHQIAWSPNQTLLQLQVIDKDQKPTNQQQQPTKKSTKNTTTKCQPLLKQVSRGFQRNGKCDYQNTIQMKNELLVFNELKKVKHYKQAITKPGSVQKRKHPVPVISRSIYSLLEIPGRHLLTNKAMPCSGGNATSQHLTWEEGQRDQGSCWIFSFSLL